MSKRTERKLNPRELPPLDERLRYSLEEAAAYLRTSRPTICKLIAENAMRCIVEGTRKYVPGSEIARRSALP